jgi:hypothetical protein
MKLPLIIIVIFLSRLSLFGSDASSYKKAYEMESVSTLFAIPLYEQTLLSSNTKNLQKVAVSRLFYLYKKHNKIVEALLLGSKYPSIISSKDKASLWASLTLIYKPLSYENLTTAYTFAFRANSENIAELSRYLQESRISQLFEFVYIVLYKRKQYELLQALFDANHSLSQSPLYEGIVKIKLDPEKGREFIENIGLDGEKDNATKSDILYLLGQYFRALGEYDLSARYFRMSGSYLWPDRGKLESAKSLVLAGNFTEACQTFSFLNPPNEEVTQIFYLTCVKKDKQFLKQVKPGIHALGAKEGGEFFQKVNQAFDRWED